MIRRLPDVRWETIHLLFGVTLEPGQTTEVRPVYAVDARGEDMGPLAAIAPFRTTSIGPHHDEESVRSWGMECGVYFTKIQLGKGDLNDLHGEALANFVMHGGFFSTSPSAADVRFTVVNRGTETVRFTGQVKGITPNKERSQP